MGTASVLGIPGSYDEGAGWQHMADARRKTTQKERKEIVEYYLASRKIVGHWSSRCRNWDMVLASSSSCSKTARPPEPGFTIVFPGWASPVKMNPV